MEIQLQELIEQIKKDGVLAAEEEAKKIVSAANSEAEKIVSDAKAKAEKMIADAKAENEKTVKSAEDNMRQAARNLLISFRESVSKEVEVITGDAVKEIYSSDALAEIIINVIEGWAKAPEAENIAVILNGEDLNKLEKTLLAALKEKALKGITFKANDNFDGGFRIAVNNGTAYYDYSAEAVKEMLSNYLNPKITEILKEA